MQSIFSLIIFQSIKFTRSEIRFCVEIFLTSYDYIWVITWKKVLVLGEHKHVSFLSFCVKNEKLLYSNKRLSLGWLGLVLVSYITCFTEQITKLSWNLSQVNKMIVSTKVASRSRSIFLYIWRSLRNLGTFFFVPACQIIMPSPWHLSGVSLSGGRGLFNCGR